jgi:hypothetical protein
MLLASIYHFSFIDRIECLLAEMTKIKSQMKKAEVDEVEAKLKQQRRWETEKETFRATLQKVTFVYIILVYIFSTSSTLSTLGCI